MGIWDCVAFNKPSAEWLIACRLRELTGKLVRQTITRDEEAELQLLQRERVVLMTPRIHR